ncbi:uncharacterized protein [Centruroides vittatus]|uniref:uncharacterized protein n=1 Tax=Centruroides vittatus TaxID=120091 RepID=UPI00350FDECB
MSISISEIEDLDSNHKSSDICNAVKTLMQDEEEKVDENKIGDCTNEESFSESDETELSIAEFIRNVQLSSAKLTSIPNNRLRPLFNAFDELETYSLVREIIYEEEEPDSTDDPSESVYSIESDTMSSEDELSEEINKNEIFDKCDIDQNMLTMAQYQPQIYKTHELTSVNPTSTCPDIESNKSNLTTKMNKISSISDELSETNWNKDVDNIYLFNNSCKIVEEKIIKKQPESVLNLCQEIAEKELDILQFDESEFELNTKHSQLNNVVGDSIGSEEFKEDSSKGKKDKKNEEQMINELTDFEEIKYDDYLNLDDEESKPRTEKEAHFEKDQYENHRKDGRRLLKRDTVPKLFSHRSAHERCSGPVA